jgi:glycosyltransferase involved in cell wall biosynthesis
MSHLVSVVIPSYNHAKFLGRALQSVLDQTYPSWEALVIDNHSQDDTKEVVRSFGDPRIRLLKIQNHGVIAASRNLGMREANGEWIAFLDSDDFWYPKKLETIMTAIDLNDAYDVLTNDELRVNIKTGIKKVLRYGPYENNFYEALLVDGNRLSPSAVVVRRKFLVLHGITWDESLDYATVEDYALWLNLAHAGARFKFIHDVQGEYVIHGANNSTVSERHWRNCETLLHDHVYNIQRFHPLPDQLWKLIYPRLRLVQVRYLVVNGQLWAALKLAAETLISFPNGTVICLISKIKKHFRKTNY